MRHSGSAMFRVCFQHLIDGGAGRSRGSLRHLEGTPTAHGVGLDPPAAVLTETFDAANVPGRVDSLKLLARRDRDRPFRAGLIEF